MSIVYGILGFGHRTGVSLLKYLKGGEIYIFDGGNREKIKELVDQNKSPQQKVHIYQDKVEFFHEKIDLLLVSPGIPAIHPLIEEAKAKRIKIQTEIDFSFERLKCPVIGITGSLGKSTMAKLSHELLLEKYKKVFLGGNYGTALVQALDKNFDIAVVEVSSFQLEESYLFHPKVSIFLNLYENHLDRHLTMDAYLQAKVRIFQNQTQDDHAIVSLDQPELHKYSHRVPTKTFSTKGNKSADIYTNGEDIVLNGKKITINCYHHPKQQVLALLLLADVFEISNESVENVLQNYQQLEHRQERIEHGDIVFINDSKSTTPDSTLFAISQFCQPIHLILCGQNKGISLDEFAHRIKKHTNIVSITVFGEVSEDLTSQLTHPNLVTVKNLEEAMSQIMRVIKSGDVVLFSPGFASFDQYKNMAARGDHFKELVASLSV